MKTPWWILLALAACKTDPEPEPDDSVPAVLDSDGDGYDVESDCDDGNAAVNPGAVEVCDGEDNNCDGEIDGADSSDATTWYTDGDGDGYGVDDQTQVACTQPEGAVAQGGDCDDSSAIYFPGAPETDCTDPNDYNCDGSVGYADADGDGFAACAECDDSEAGINPDAAEVCDGVDNNCSGEADEGVTTTYYQDRDGDSYGDADYTQQGCEAPAGYTTDSTDCDDDVAAVNPGAAEVCNGVDDDCDGALDDADEDVDLSTGTQSYTDSDGDGYGDSTDAGAWSCTVASGRVTDATDCDDSAAAVNPAATEVCNGVDDNCDGAADGTDSADVGVYYADWDEDGYGDPEDSAVACEPPSGYVTDDSDCDGDESSTYPGATEYCDGWDNNCDGVTDEDSAADASTWYLDSDADGYGDSGSTTLACEEPSGYAALSTDCDDADATSYPGATELCDGLDNDCDGTDDDGVLGSSASCPAADCAEIYDVTGSTTDGTYVLDSGSYYCLMSKYGGGWTRVMDNAPVYGTSWSTSYYNTEGFTWDEVLFQYDSGSVSAHCSYPGSMTGCNNLGFQFASESWGVPLNWGSSICGMATTSYTSATSYVGGYDFKVSRSSSTATIRLGSLEGISSCTTGDNSGTAYVDIYVRQ